MKLFLSVLFIHISCFVFAQDPERTDISPDSFYRMVMAKRNESLGKPFPDFKISNKRIAISNNSLKGKVVMINFWFAACPPCIAEMKALNDMYEKLRHEPRFIFVSFTYESPEKIAVLKKKLAMKYEVFSVSTAECYRLNQNNAFPTSIILDKDGTISFITFGGNTSKKKAREEIFNVVYPKIQQLLKRN